MPKTARPTLLEQVLLLIAAATLLQAALPPLATMTDATALASFGESGLRFVAWITIWGLQTLLITGTRRYLHSLTPLITLGFSIVFAITAGPQLAAGLPATLAIAGAAGWLAWQAWHRDALASGLVGVGALATAAVSFLPIGTAAGVLWAAQLVAFAGAMRLARKTGKLPVGHVVLLVELVLGLLLIQLASDGRGALATALPAAIAIGLMLAMYAIAGPHFTRAATHLPAFVLGHVVLLASALGFAGLLRLNGAALWLGAFRWALLAAFCLAVFSLLTWCGESAIDTGYKRWFFIGFTLLIDALYTAMTLHLALPYLIGTCAYLLAVTLYVWQFMIQRATPR
ncbi:hypothetical protein [Lacticaseibacillus mingshuiensis]|uniref:Uncharacterized protein n=1 Tax=Lacticaseibacillus mingshuiensis TaxID=2799574 RepID=A0ABW4CJJ7_9LACO|nr:hypothetical protein [Lacticaseibacillus mingshuiensis]